MRPGTGAATRCLHEQERGQHGTTPRARGIRGRRRPTVQNLQPRGCAAMARIELVTAEGEPDSGPAATDMELVEHHGHAGPAQCGRGCGHPGRSVTVPGGPSRPLSRASWTAWRKAVAESDGVLSGPQEDAVPGGLRLVRDDGELRADDAVDAVDSPASGRPTSHTKTARMGVHVTNVAPARSLVCGCRCPHGAVGSRASGPSRSRESEPDSTKAPSSHNPDVHPQGIQIARTWRHRGSSEVMRHTRRLCNQRWNTGTSSPSQSRPRSSMRRSWSSRCSTTASTVEEMRLVDEKTDTVASRWARGRDAGPIHRVWRPDPATRQRPFPVRSRLCRIRLSRPSPARSGLG